MQDWSLGFFGASAFVATFGFGGLSPDGRVFAPLLCFLLLGISSLALVYRLCIHWTPPSVNLHLRIHRTLTPSSIARVAATRP
jgi:hypothetical protein